MILVVRYINYFIKQGKLLHFFGSWVVASSVIFVVASLLLVLQQRSIADVAPPIQQLVRLAFVIANSAALTGFLRPFFSGAQSEYLLYMRLSKKQRGALACAAALPAILAGALFFFVALTDGLAWGLRLCLTLAATLAGGAMSFLFLWLQKRWETKKRSATKRTVQRTSLLRAFSSPYHAFFRKDLYCLRRFDLIFAGVILLLFGMGITAIAWFATPAWQTFAIRLYCLLLMVILILPNGLYEREANAIMYYQRQLRLKDSQILIYRLPLQILILVCYVLTFTVIDALGHGLTKENLCVAVGLALYASATCAAISWWYIQQLQSKSVLIALHIFPLFILSTIPFGAIGYLLVSCLKGRRSRLNRGNQDA